MNELMRISQNLKFLYSKETKCKLYINENLELKWTPSEWSSALKSTSNAIKFSESYGKSKSPRVKKRGWLFKIKTMAIGLTHRNTKIFWENL